MKSGLRFLCTVSGLPEETFQVVNFTLTEGLSALFTLQLTVASDKADIDLDKQLLTYTKLMILRGQQTERTICGWIASMSYAGYDKRQAIYTLTVRPDLWTLTLNQDSRIYHLLSVPDILQQILRQNRIRADDQFKYSHNRREYTTMKRESYYDFIDRLCAEEGVFYWEDDKGKVHYSDTHEALDADITLTYNPQLAPNSDGNTAIFFSVGATLCSQIAIHKDRNHHNPNYALQHQADSPYSSDPTLTVFESYGRFQMDEEGKPFTRRRLDAYQAESKNGTAHTDCARLRPGKRFTLTNHPLEPLNNQWQVVRVTSRGHQPDVLGNDPSGQGTTFSNEVHFIPGNKTWRPPFRYKPLADGDEVATVVGAGNEEIYVNKDGEIRVHFHWNRYDKADDRASCWIRVAQGWNGAGYGFWATPRVGQEVIISYLNGDIDRPIVTGCTYNGINRTPLNLPIEKTRTTFKTKTHKGDGFNELRFEDEYNQEEIYIHAQKDMNIQVLNNKSERVDHDRSSSIGHDETLVVANNRIITVEQQQDVTIKANDIKKVEADKSLTVLGDLMQKVNGNMSVDSRGDLVLESKGKMTLKVGNSFIVLHPGGIDINAPRVNIGHTVNIVPSGSPSSPRAPLNPQLLKSMAGIGAPFIERCPANFTETFTPEFNEYQRIFIVENKQREPVPNIQYRITKASGEIIEGVTDQEGRTEWVFSEEQEDVTLEYNLIT